MAHSSSDQPASETAATTAVGSDRSAIHDDQPSACTPSTAESPFSRIERSDNHRASDSELPLKMPHDSMVTVRLSEPPPTLTLDTSEARLSAIKLPKLPPSREVDDVGADSDSSSSGGNFVAVSDARESTATAPLSEASRNLQDELGDCDNRSEKSSSSEEVNWEELEKTEDEQTKDEETDNSTALLLARLEQENAKLATNPKTVKVQTVEKLSLAKPRPPSMAQLRQMVTGPTPPALRYSMLPPPPMTDLEFYAALVKDYQQTAARLPTLLSNKIRKGIPPPLRGVVWQSMAGARDTSLREQYERFCGESSPYELLIGKDLGRSFPGVDMFREPEGDGQRMLGRVLKSFSLYDTKIGYCQGLAFLVGPLLMHMPDEQAFCVLVRLMEKYDLRECFLPDLAGLHVRIYQFRELLRINLPALSNHLEDLQVETAYVSQWFLSFFAVTCPLPMLFRIYDVIFAEGASETLMRVALSLMKKNEARLLACAELEDVMQLLLSRGLWDCYHYDADEFVQDFVGMTGIVTRERLSQLEQSYRESLIATANAPRASDITTSATRFLGRIWNSSSAKTATLTPGTAATGRPVSILRRSTSKQSLASTLNSMEVSSASVSSLASTDASTVSRDSSHGEDDSSRESTPVGSKTTTTKADDERYLHSQIEDLLTALSELQRNHALLSNLLQSEREEREEDRKAVRSLLDGLRKKATTGSDEHEHATHIQDGELQESGLAGERPAAKLEKISAIHAEEGLDEEEGEATSTEVEDSDATPTAEEPDAVITVNSETSICETPTTEDLSVLLGRVERRFENENRRSRSSLIQSKSQLRDELLNTKDQLTSAISHSQELSRQIYDLNQEISSLKEQLRDRHGHVRSLHQDKQRLEKQIHGMRARGSSTDSCHREGDQDAASGTGKSGGLRELKLGRSHSTPSQGGFGKRTSSMPIGSESVAAGIASGSATPPNEHEALLLELVQAKTAEAMAKQEAEEAKQKLEALRKAQGLPASDSTNSFGPVSSVLGRLTGSASTNDIGVKVTPAAGATTSGNAGGFWGWRR